MMRDDIDLEMDGRQPLPLDVFIAELLKLAPDFNRAVIQQAMLVTKNKTGGMPHYQHKIGPRKTKEQRQAIYNDGLTKMSNEEIAEKHKISVRTIYSIMKQGGGRFSR